MLELQFTNAVFNKEINLTVRRGVKWNTINEKVFINKKEIKILYTKVVVAKDILESDLVFEHDEKCRTKDGIMTELKRLYPNFTENEIVTMIFFEFIDNEN